MDKPSGALMDEQTLGHINLDDGYILAGCWQPESLYYGCQRWLYRIAANLADGKLGSTEITESDTQNLARCILDA